MTLIEPEIVEEQKLDDGDHDRMTHILRKLKGDPRPAEAIVTEARVMGTPITAWCGKQWVPEHNPDNHPMCQTCIKAVEAATGKPWPGRR